MMDKGKGKAPKIEPSSWDNFDEWMNEKKPDVTADVAARDHIGTRRQGTILPSSNLNNYNQQRKAINLGANHNQVSAMTSNTKLGMLQISSSTSDVPNHPSSQNVASTFNNFSQSRANNTFSNLHQSNINHMPAQSNAYMNTRRQHQPMQQQQTSLGRHSINPVMARQQSLTNVLQHNNLMMTSQKPSEAQSDLLPETGYQNIPINQPHNLTMVDQQKPGNQSQGMIFGSSQASINASTPQEQSTDSMDWVDLAFRKIQMMKEKYTSALTLLIKRTTELKEKSANVDHENRWERYRAFAEKTLRNMNTSRPLLAHAGKHRVYQWMYDTERSLRCLGGPKSPLASQPRPPQQAEPSVNLVQVQQMQQQREINYPHINSRQEGSSSQMGFDQDALRMLLQPTNSGVQQRTVSPSRNALLNSLEYSAGSITTRASSISASPQKHNKQRGDAIKRQQMKLDKRHQQQQTVVQKRNEDTTMRQFLGFSQKNHVNSPQNTQNTPSPLTTTPSSGIPAPLTPLTPSSAQTDSGRGPMILEESSKITLQPQPMETPAAPPAHLSLQDTDLPTESAPSPGEKQLPCAKDTPVQRLVAVIQRMSPKALTSAVRDLEAVTQIADRIPVEPLPGDPTRFIFHDLAGDISSIRASMETRINRNIECTPLNDFTDGMQFHAIDRLKRLKKEPNDLLVQEIKEINHILIELAVDVKDVSDKGTMLRCSYNPVGLSWNTEAKKTSKSMFPNLVLDLMVPADYPKSSPTVVETLPPVCSETEEGKHLWMKAKTNFDLTLHKSSKIVSVKEMAKAWNACARQVFCEFARRMGGGSFSSTYGKWDNYVVAN